MRLACVAVSEDEIKRLALRFKKLDKDGSGALSPDEFLSLPELQQNPLVSRVIATFDKDGGGDVDFQEFIQGLSVFSSKGDKLAKLKCRTGQGAPAAVQLIAFV